MDYSFAREKQTGEDATRYLESGRLSLPQFSHYLNYAGWNDEFELFVLSNIIKGKESISGVGFTIELNPYTGANDEIADRMLAILTALPKDASVQFHVLSSPDIQDSLIGFRASQDYSEFYSTRAQRRVEWYHQASLGMRYQGSVLKFRNLRFALSVTLPATMKKLQNRTSWEEAARIRDANFNTLSALGMAGRKWTPEDLIQFTTHILNPNEMLTGFRPIIRYDNKRPIREQILEGSQLVRFPDSGDRVIFGADKGAVSVQMASARSYPDQFRISDVGSLLGDFFTPQLAYTCPYLITLWIKMGDFESDKQKITLKAARATKAAESPIARFVPALSAKKRDMDIVQRSIARGEGIVELNHQITLIAKPGEAERAFEVARQIWRGRGIDLSIDKYMQSQALLASLPMGLDRGLQLDIRNTKRYSTKIAFNAINMAPIVSEWSGLNSPMILLFGRRGQVMSIDPFANTAGNYNVAISGQSGTGKSVVLNEIAVNTLGSGGLVRIIDIGRSFQKNCELLGGQFIEFSETSGIRLNPFSFINDFTEDVDLLLPMFGQMISPNAPLADYEKQQLNLALHHLWEHRTDGQLLSIDQLANYLSFEVFDQDGKIDPAVRRMGVQLFPYTSKGQYGTYFEGPANIDFKSEFVVLELEELKSKPDLQKVVMLLVIYKISHEMYLTRDRKKVVIIDEAWDLMKGGSTADFIETGYRRARKYKGSFVTGTQGVDDFYKNAASTAAFLNSDWVWMLRTKSESIQALAESKRFDLDPYKRRVLESVRTEHGLFSEIFVSCPVGYGVGRLVLDPYSLIAASSRAEDMEAVAHYTNQGMSMALAIAQVLNDREAAKNN